MNTLELYFNFSIIFISQERSVNLLGDPKSLLAKPKGSFLFSYHTATAATQILFTINAKWQRDFSLSVAKNPILLMSSGF